MGFEENKIVPYDLEGGWEFLLSLKGQGCASEKVTLSILFEDSQCSWLPKKRVTTHSSNGVK